MGGVFCGYGCEDVQYTGFEAVRRRWIRGHVADCVRHASYDLRVAKVLVGGEEQRPKGSRRKYFEIEPQEVAVIVSEEEALVPTCGGSCYAFPKTTLCKDGLLVLNTGVVDPGYEGLISTTAVNFQKTRLRLDVGDAFLRLVFFEFRGTKSDVSEVGRVCRTEYLEKRLEESGQLPTTFLDVPDAVKRLGEGLKQEMFDVNYKKMAVVAGVAALVATIVLSLVPLLVPLGMERLRDDGQEERLRDLEAKFDALGRVVEGLERGRVPVSEGRDVAVGRGAAADINEQDPKE